MKKKVLNELKDIASKLPVFKIRSKQGVKYSGEYLRSVNTYVIDGRQVDPDKTYTIFPLSDVNHYVNLKSIYEKEGMDGVVEYVDIIKKQFENKIPG